MPAKKFTLLIIPEGSHQVRRYSLKRSALKGLMAVVALCCLVLTGFTTDYVLTNLDEAEFARLQEENQQQRNELQKVGCRSGQPAA